MSDTSPPSRRPINPWTVWSLILIVVLGIVVGANVVNQSLRKSNPNDGRPRLLGRIEKTPELIERSGERVTLAALAGKVYLTCYVYTTCPRQCMGVLAEMKAIGKELGSPANLHFVAFSLEPEVDTPARLKEWANLHGVDTPDWWFLTTDTPKEMTALMTGPKSQFKLIEARKFDPATEAERIVKEGAYEHDPRVVLVDTTGHIRGYYNLLSPDAGDIMREKLLRDAKMVLAETQPAGRSLWWVAGLVAVVALFLALTGGRKSESPATSQVQP